MAEYIDRQTAIDVFENLADEDWNKNTGTTWANAFIEVAGMIAGIPNADVRPVVRGQWDIQACGMEGEDVFCSVCGCGSNLPYWPFCPNCGADMREDER